MFYAPGLIFDGIEGIRSRFHIFRSRTCFWGYRGRRVPFSCFALPDSFSTVPRAPSPVFMFCLPRLVFGGNEGVGYLFHVLRSRTHFRRYRVRRVPFSCFALPYSFSSVPRASRPVFMFYAPGLIFGDTECVGSRFHVLRSRTHFRRYRGRPASFSCFTIPDSFFGGTDGARSRFHDFRSRTCFWGYRLRQVPLSRLALPDSFSAVPRASGPVFMFCAPGLIFGGT
jgi:hypothetical protein